MSLVLISPTGRGIRGQDNWGSGAHNAPRGKRKHDGVDFICKPGQKVQSPIYGRVVRVARPYVDSPYLGCLIANERLEIKLFYFKPDISVIGKDIKQGDYIGIAQDISIKYPGIVPHLHLQITNMDPNLLLRGEE